MTAAEAAATSVAQLKGGVEATMKKIVTIHQPEAFPWLGFFNKMMLADEYVILDNVQFRKNYFQNRNQFLSNNGPLFLTIPVSHSSDDVIKDVAINNSSNWQKKHLSTIKHNYSKHKYFKDHLPFFESLYNQQISSLVDFNMAVIDYVRDVLKITTPLLKASSIDAAGSSTELLLNVCEARNAATYISGRDGRDYLETALFDRSGINIVYHDFSHPHYSQSNSREFVPYMSTFDLLFNYSTEESRQIILSGGSYCDA